MKSRLIIKLITVVGVSLFLTHSLFAQGQRETIAESGRSANGDGNYWTFSQMFLNDAGDVLFKSYRTRSLLPEGNTTREMYSIWLPVTIWMYRFVVDDQMFCRGQNSRLNR